MQLNYAVFTNTVFNGWDNGQSHFSLRCAVEVFSIMKGMPVTFRKKKKSGSIDCQ